MSMYDLNHGDPGPEGWIAHTPHLHTLTISDVERLAKAGVTMSFADIKHQVVPDAAPVPQEQDVFRHPDSLVESFWQRWRRANPRRMDTFGPITPYVIASATEYGDKVYVCVAPTDREPFILEDDKHLYPSDALMAKLHLMERTK